ncbi:MAG: Ubiquitin-like protein [Alyxoria varia]|nr:MAG: Ubiquitin-like protein [Alyxoria varia]
MASPSPDTGGAPIPEDGDQEADMPLTMAASMILTSLPKNAHEALEGAGELPQAKVNVRFKPVGAAEGLKQPVYKITSTHRFETVVNFLRKKLGVKPQDSVFCYVNNVFSPGLDEVVGNLWRCFKTQDELIVYYAMMPVFG